MGALLAIAAAASVLLIAFATAEPPAAEPTRMAPEAKGRG